MITKISVLFLFISTSRGLHNDGNFFDFGFPSNNAPFFPPPPHTFPTPPHTFPAPPHSFPAPPLNFPLPSHTFPGPSVNPFGNLFSNENFHKDKCLFDQFLEMKEFQQFLNMKRSGLMSSNLPPFNPGFVPLGPVPVLNTYLGDQWKPPANSVPIKVPVQVQPPVPEPPKKSPVYVQMFEIPKSLLERLQNSTKIETSALPEVLGAKSVSPVVPLEKLPAKNEKNETENKVFLERITKPEYKTVKVVLDLPK